MLIYGSNGLGNVFLAVLRDPLQEHLEVEESSTPLLLPQRKPVVKDMKILGISIFEDSIYCVTAEHLDLHSLFLLHRI